MINHTVLIGRLTSDPDLKYIDEKPVLNMVIAVKRPTKDDKADFPMIAVFGRLAVHCNEYLKKGSLIGVDGQIRTSKYKDGEGTMQYRTNIVADRIDFLNSPKEEIHEK